jgi:hypothetical protein
MEPVEEIGQRMLTWGLVKLAAGCLLLFAMWAWLRRKLLRPEKIAHA